MRYAVVSCPRCGRSRVAESGTATAGCPSCGKRFELGKAARGFETDSLAAARSALAVVNSGDPDVLAKVAGRAKARGEIEALRSVEDRLERAAAVARMLTARSGDFAGAEFYETAKMAGLKDPEKALGSAVEAGLVFEPKPGRYRAL